MVRKSYKVLFLMMVMMLVACLFCGTEGIAKAKSKVETEKKTIEVGEEAISIFYENQERYTYKSSDTEVAKVDERGNITGVSPGKAKIVVKTKGKKAKTVKIVNVTAKLVTTKFTIGICEECSVFQLVGLKDYTYDNSNPKVAKVDKEGNITGVSAGKTKIVAKFKGKKKTKTVKIVNVIVKEAEIDAGDDIITDQKGACSYVFYNLMYENFKATYSAKVSDENQASKVKVEQATSNCFFFWNLEGNAGEQFDIDVYETYQEVSKKIGTVTVKLESPKADEDHITVSMYGESEEYIYPSFSNVAGYHVYVTENPDFQLKEPMKSHVEQDSNMIEVTEDEWWYPTTDYETIPSLVYKAKSTGVVYLYCYAHNYLTNESEKDCFAKIQVTINE